MNQNDILKTVDHTLLKQTTTWEEIKKICEDGIEYGVASVCIPPSFVKKAYEFVNGNIAICTVIGFPNGYSTTEVKVFETENAIRNGASEIDMVINLGMLKEGSFDEICEEIKQIKKACGDKILKVIIETCLLSENEKIEMCKVVTKAGADFIKTSTGFSTGGATIEDIVLFKKYVGENISIKAAGGITSIAVAEDFIEKGASRLGTSSIMKIINNEKVGGY